MVYVVRVSCHIYLDIHLDIYLNVHLTAPQSVSAIRVHSLVLPSSSTMNLRS